ncbi:hypothetical protein ACFL35_03325 [Candidatus Riflebacteria bacterium]
MNQKIKQLIIFPPIWLLLLLSGYLAIYSYVTWDYWIDDAYIGFRYIQNFLAGNGLTFNPFEKVEGITNIGWLLFLLPFSFFGELPVVTKVLTFFLVFFTCLLVYQSAYFFPRTHFDKIFLYPLPFFVITEFNFLYFSMAGMETALFSACLCAIIYLSIIQRFWFLKIFLFSFLFLIHPEGILIFPLYFCLSFLFNVEEKRDLFIKLGCFSAFILLYTGIRYFLFSDFLPNTFYAKVPNDQSIIQLILCFFLHFEINISWQFQGIIALLFFGSGLMSLWQKSPRLCLEFFSIICTGIFFSIYAPDDWTEQARYFAPYVPLAYVLFWNGALAYHHRMLKNLMSTESLQKLFSIYIIIILMLQLYHNLTVLSDDRRESYPGYVITGTNLIPPAKWMKKNVPADATIATRRIGILAYFSQKKVFDYVHGLIDREIAQMVRARGKPFNNPKDLQLRKTWLQRSPDYFLEDLHFVIENIVNKGKDKPHLLQIHGLKYYLKESFQIGKFGIQWALFEKKK